VDIKPSKHDKINIIWNNSHSRSRRN